MNLGTLLDRVKLVHVKRRERGRFVSRQEHREADRWGMRPVAGADIVRGAGVEPAGRHENAVGGSNAHALGLPAEDEWLKKEIREPSTGAELTLGVGGERVVRDQQ